MKKPSRLFHGTSPNNVPSIEKEGLHTPWMTTYFCESIDECFRIVGGRVGIRFTGIEWQQVLDEEMIAILRANTEPMTGVDLRDDGTVWRYLPMIERNTHMAIVEVDVQKLHAGSLDISDDHSALALPDLRSWVYFRDVPPSAILHTTIVPLGVDHAAQEEVAEEGTTVQHG